MFMKGKFDAYVLWPLDKRVRNWIVDQCTAPDFTVCQIRTLGSKEFYYLNFVTCILTCFQLTNFFGDIKNSAGCLFKTKWLMKICIFWGTHIFSSNYNVQFFHQLLLEVSRLEVSKLKFVKWMQVKITNMILHRP